MTAKKINYDTMEPREILKRQQAWADYVRLRLHPTKRCTQCKQSFPNTREHFGVNVNGRIIQRCLVCLGKKPAAVHTMDACPCCGNRHRLVFDRYAPIPVRLCRRCLALINTIDATTEKTMTHIAEYLDWRKRGQQAQVIVNPKESAPDYIPEPGASHGTQT